MVVSLVEVCNVYCSVCGTDDPDLWNQTLEAEDLQQIQSAVEKAEKQETGIVQQAGTASTTAQCGKKRRVDAASLRV